MSNPLFAFVHVNVANIYTQNSQEWHFLKTFFMSWCPLLVSRGITPKQVTSPLSQANGGTTPTAFANFWGDFTHDHYGI